MICTVGVDSSWRRKVWLDEPKALTKAVSFYALILCSSQHRFQPQNPLSGAQQFVAKDPQEDDDLKLCSHTMMLPTRGQLEGRMIVTAYEHGLDNVTEEAVTAVVYAVEVRRGWPAVVFPFCQQQKALCAVRGGLPHWREETCFSNCPVALGGVKSEAKGFWVCASGM